MSAREVRQRQLGERRRVGGLADEHFARLGDRLVDLPALPQRGDELRANVDRVRVRLHEVREPLGASLVLSAPPAHLCQRDGEVGEVGRHLRRGFQLVLRFGEVACPRQHRTEVEARLPEVRVGADRVPKERDRPLALAILRGLDALNHAAHGDGVRRRESDGLCLRRGGATAPARGSEERRRHLGRDDRAARRANRCLHREPWAVALVATGRFGASMSGGMGRGACERTSNPVSLKGGYSSLFNRPSASRIFAVHWL